MPFKFVKIKLATFKCGHSEEPYMAYNVLKYFSTILYIMQSYMKFTMSIKYLTFLNLTLLVVRWV